MPANHLTRERLSEEAAAHRGCHRVTASAWAQWKAGQLGIVIPEAGVYERTDWNIHTDYATGASECIVTRQVSSRWSNEPLGQSWELARFPIPSHALDCRRVDLWHAAHQSGVDAALCGRIGNLSSRDADYKAVENAARTLAPAEFRGFLTDLCDRWERDREAIRRRWQRAERDRLTQLFATEIRAEELDGESFHGRPLDSWGDGLCNRLAMHRDGWLKRARYCRDAGVDLVALCVTRSRLFHRLAMGAV